MSKIKLALIFIACLFSVTIYASEPAQPEVTIDSPPEVIAEDFVRVAVAPPSWVYLIYNWLGTFDIDPRKVTESDIDNLVKDKKQNELTKQAIETIKQFKTYPDQDRLKKWVNMPIKIGITHEKMIDDQIKLVTKKIEESTGIKFIINDELNYDGMNIYTYGLQRENTDYCVHDPKCGSPHHRDYTKYFKGDGGAVSLSTIWPWNFNKSPIKKKNQYEFITRFTMDTSFSKRHKSDYHVMGAVTFDSNSNIKVSSCDIYNNHENQNITKSLTTECILRSLGLTQFSGNPHAFLAPRSIVFEKIEWKLMPTEYDLMLLKLLYDNGIKPGMDKKETLETVKAVLANSNFDKKGDK